jgi:hypothetical protein
MKLVFSFPEISKDATHDAKSIIKEIILKTEWGLTINLVKRKYIV